MIDISSLTNNLAGESMVYIVIVTTSISFLLSLLIALIYQKTNDGLETPKYFIQSLVLISIPVATVMQAIGDSLARGIGILGALTIIRFRTVLKNPRNIAFMFASISVGIATGVYGISIAIVGTLAFCTVVLILHFSKFEKINTITFTLQIEILNDTLLFFEAKEEIDKTLNNLCEKKLLQTYSAKNKEDTDVKIKSLKYEIEMKDTARATKLVDVISEINGVFNVKINFKEYDEKI